MGDISPEEVVVYANDLEKVEGSSVSSMSNSLKPDVVNPAEDLNSTDDETLLSAEREVFSNDLDSDNKASASDSDVNAEFIGETDGFNGFVLGLGEDENEACEDEIIRHDIDNLENLTLSDKQGSKTGLTMATSKPKEDSRTQSEVDMQNVLEQISESSKLEGTLKEINGDKYQLVVEKYSEEKEKEDFCCICRDQHENPKILDKCSHKFCTECIDTYFKIKPVCPECFVAYGVVTGNQPKGHMSDTISKKVHLPGYEKFDTIVLHYSFSDGTQTAEHPKPGQSYYGTSRTAYLPNNAEGQKVLRLLREAFNRRLVFTIGQSRTTGCDDVVTWNDIHHKTCTHGGQENFGYPDATYLERVQQELAAFGVTEESLNLNKKK